MNSPERIMNEMKGIQDEKNDKSRDKEIFRWR